MISSAPPLLATVDVEIAHDRDLLQQVDALWRLGSQLRGSPMTWFCTAEAAECFAQPLRSLALAGHTIGCHGLDHGTWEDYRQLPPQMALQTLAQATDRIERAIGVRPRAFRGPRMTTSAATHAALRSLGYTADFSTCARRFDLMAASRFDARWLTTGPAPYRPAPDDPFLSMGPPVAGDLTVVPLSGLGIPLVSGALYLLGGRLMSSMAQLMVRAATKAKAPLVYLFHSYEFVDMAGVVDHRPLHHRWYPASAERRCQLNQQFLDTLQFDMGLEPLGADQYIGGLTHDATHHQAHDPHLDRERGHVWPGDSRSAYTGTHPARPPERP
jgi:hypothetical protein